MKIQATIKQEVVIDPKEVIQKLLYNSIQEGSVFDKNGKFYQRYEVRTSHSYDDEIEISEKKYRYVKALQLVFDTLKNMKISAV